MPTLDDILEGLGDGSTAGRDLVDICAVGGRFAGSASESDAKSLLTEKLAAIGRPVVSIDVDYAGWSRGESVLERAGRRYSCVSLVRSPATPDGGLDAELIDIGRGAKEDFDRHGPAIAGRIVMVRHEYMFSASTVHRRRKYQWAMDRGAVGFVIASHLPGDMPVTGSSGAEPGRGIPAVGISAVTAAAIGGDGAAGATLRMRIEVSESSAHTDNLLLEIPGRSADWVVLCAHLDGHHLAESAMDNATGLAGVLAIARLMAPLAGRLERGLRIVLFSVEEWALTGSRRYVEGLDDAERAAIACVINLDSIAGSPNLTALTSGYADSEPFLMEAAHQAGSALGVYRPIMANSDHYNFAANGIPAVRIVAGFDEPDSNMRYVLTPGDTLARITRQQMSAATRAVAAMVFNACQAPHLEWRNVPEN